MRRLSTDVPGREAYTRRGIITYVSEQALLVNIDHGTVVAINSSTGDYVVGDVVDVEYNPTVNSYRVI